MKVLHVLPSLDERYGGPLRAVLDLSAHSQSADFQSEILAFGPMHIRDNPLPWELIHNLPVSFPRQYCYCPDLQDWLRKHLDRFDGVVLHSMWLYPNWAVSRACKVLGKPYISFPHGMLEPWSVFGQGRAKTVKKLLYWKFREKKVLEGGVAAVFTATRELKMARLVLRFRNIKLAVVPYGCAISVGRARPSSDMLRLADRKLALFLGRIHPAKNLPFLLHAWAAASPGPEWLLVVAGPGERRYVSGLQQLTRTLGIDLQVKFVGMLTGADKSYFFKQAKWFLLPSQHENFGNAVAEAIQHACPVAISDQVYFAESFHDEAEILPLTSEAWTEFIRYRMPDELHRQKLIEKDRLHFANRLNIAYVAKQWATALSDLFLSAPQIADPRALSPIRSVTFARNSQPRDEST